MSMSASITQKDDVDDVATQLTDVTQYLQNTTIEDLSILISSLEGVSNDSVASSIVKKEEDNNIINNKNILSKLIETTVTLHVWNEFTNYLHRKYPKQIPEGVFQAEIDAAFLGIVNKFNSQKSTTTSSTSLLFEGKPPRQDVMVRLADIATSLANHPTFPETDQKHIRTIIGVIVGKDERTQKKYFECIKQYSTPTRDDNWNLSYDVRLFFNLIPRELLYRERS